MKMLLIPLLTNIYFLTIGNGVDSTKAPFRVFDVIEQIEDESNPGSVFLKVKHFFEYIFNSEPGPNVDLIVTLPNEGDILVEYQKSNSMGDDLEDGDPYQVWKGFIDTSEMEIEHPLALNRAVFTLSPKGRLTCYIKFDRREFRCKPCETYFMAENDADCAVIREEKVNHDNELKDDPPFRIEDFEGKKRIPKGSIKLSEVRKIHHKKPRNLLVDGDAGDFQRSVVDFLMLVSLKALEYFGSEEDMIATFYTAVDDANDIYIKSRIEVELKIVAIELLPGYVETGTTADSLEFIELSDDVAAMRDELGADLVTFITSDYAVGEDYIGWSIIADPASKDEDGVAFSVVDCEHLKGTFQMLHEIGHNFGCNHEAEMGKTMELDYAYGYRSEDEWYTIMAYADREDQIPYFSSPIVYSKEVSSYTGTDEADCVRVHNEYKDIISNFR